MSVQIKWTDENIIKGILAGGRHENDAIEALYDRFRGTLTRFIEHKQSKRYALESEDIIWETIFAVVLNIKDGKYLPQPNTNLEAYVKSISRNLWHKYLASEIARENRQEHYIEDADDLDPDVSEMMINKEIWDRYLVIFESLGKNCKELLHLTFAEDVPMKDLAELMIKQGKYENEQVVRNAKSKCLKKLLEVLEEKK